MRKLFLFGTALCVVGTISTNAWSFGGLGILGHKSSHKGGVNTIGVHIDADNKEQPNIDIRSCDSETEELVGSECCKKTLIYTDNDTTKCCSLEGYAVQDGKCKKQCESRYVFNEETGDCECPVERQCGETCCGTGHVCVGGNKCCYGGTVDDYDDTQCCDASVSTGIRYYGDYCCSGDEIAYFDGQGGTDCCPANKKLTDFYDEWGLIGTTCCEPNETPYISGEGGWSGLGCCPVNTKPYVSSKTEYQLTRDCCAPDKIVYGAGENGADECLE